MTRFRLSDKVIRARNAGGVVWGSDIYVILRIGNKELWWIPGSPYWIGSLGGAIHTPSLLEFIEDGDTHWRRFRSHTQNLHEGGRLSRSLILDLQDTIDTLFEVPGLSRLVAKYCLGRKRRTLVADETGDLTP
jgi:hypothetical protein